MLVFIFSNEAIEEVKDDQFISLSNFHGHMFEIGTKWSVDIPQWKGDFQGST